MKINSARYCEFRRDTETMIGREREREKCLTARKEGNKINVMSAATLL